MSCFCRPLVSYVTGTRGDRGRRAGLASGRIPARRTSRSRFSTAAPGAVFFSSAVLSDSHEWFHLDFLDETLTCEEPLLLSSISLNSRTTGFGRCQSPPEGSLQLAWVHTCVYPDC